MHRAGPRRLSGEAGPGRGRRGGRLHGAPAAGPAWLPGRGRAGGHRPAHAPGNLGTSGGGGRGGVDVTAVFAVDACRTPVGKIKGSLATARPDHLTADVIA